MLILIAAEAAPARADSLFKQHTFRVNITNSLQYVRQQYFHHESFPLHPHDYYRNVTITERSVFFAPGISMCYLFRIKTRQNDQDRTSSAGFVSFTVGWQRFHYRNEKNGIQYGGLTGTYFSGKIQEKSTVEYLVFKPGINAYFTNYKRRVLGVGTSFGWLRLFDLKYRYDFHEDLTNNHWTTGGRIDARLTPHCITNTRGPLGAFLPKYDHFVWDFYVSIGKWLSGHLTEFSIGYRLTEYSILDKPYQYTFDSSFLKNYHLLSCGISCTL